MWQLQSFVCSAAPNCALPGPRPGVLSPSTGQCFRWRFRCQSIGAGHVSLFVCDVCRRADGKGLQPVGRAVGLTLSVYATGRHGAGSVGIRHGAGSVGIRHGAGSVGIRHGAGSVGIRHGAGSVGIRHGTGSVDIRHGAGSVGRLSAHSARPSPTVDPVPHTDRQLLSVPASGCRPELPHSCSASPPPPPKPGTPAEHVFIPSQQACQRLVSVPQRPSSICRRRPTIFRTTPHGPADTAAAHCRAERPLSTEGQRSRDRVAG